MRVLFNCTTNVAGGGVQNAANFIARAIDDASIEFRFAVSFQVLDLLHRWDIRDSRITALASPIRDRSARRDLFGLERAFDPDLVYTMAGPAYVRFRCRHLLGLSRPYITHGDWQAMTTGRKLLDVWANLAKSILQGIWCRLEGDHWIFQTETSRTGYCRRYRAARSRTYVVPNAVGATFAALVAAPSSKIENNPSKLRIFCPAADYPHKNLLIVPSLVRRMRDDDRFGDFEFLLTIPQASDTWRRIAGRLSADVATSYVRTIGPFSYEEAGRLNQEAHVVFVPSLLETFSTSYLEAIVSLTPLVVPNKGFARRICGRDAIYFDPRDNEDAVDALAKAAALQSTERLQEARNRILTRYGTYQHRYTRIKEVFVAVLSDSDGQ